jgi:hypothetical protein
MTTSRKPGRSLPTATAYVLPDGDWMGHMILVRGGRLDLADPGGRTWASGPRDSVALRLARRYGARHAVWTWMREHGVARPAETRHGATQPEEARKRPAVVIRMSRESVESLREIAAAWGSTLGEVVESALVALQRNATEILSRKTGPEGETK